MSGVFYKHTVWNSETSEYEKHRIPGMIVTGRGTVIVYNEARLTPSDWARMDIFAQRSEDQGRTFGERIYLARSDERVQTVNNPVMVEDGKSRIHFLYCENYGISGGRMLHRVSADDGMTWSEAQDVTPATLPYYRNAFAFGPGHGIRTETGALIVPVWLVPKCYGQAEHSHNPSVISTFFSLDDGESWQLGDIIKSSESVVSPNETEVTLTRDGRVYLNARNHSHYRAAAYSPNGYSGWTDLRLDQALGDAICFGSCVTYRDAQRQAILMGHCACLTERKQVTIEVSFDDGRTWAHKKLLDADHGGYVEMGVDSARGLIYVLYEEDWGAKCHLNAFDFDWLMQV